MADQPTVPAYQPFDTSTLLQPWSSFYQPMTSQDYLGFLNDIYPSLQGQYMNSLGSIYPALQNQYSSSLSSLYPQLQNQYLSSLRSVYPTLTGQYLNATGDSMQQQVMAMGPTVQKGLSLMPQIYQQQLDYIPYFSDVINNTALNSQLFNQKEQAWNQYQVDANYMEPYAYLYNDVVNAGAPGLMDTYENLGQSINEGLDAGYDLGAELTKETEDAIRAAQTSRGNWLGPAPTAQEAYGMGQASVDLYNQRIAQAQDYLNGQNPMDLWDSADYTTQALPRYDTVMPSQTYIPNGVPLPTVDYGTSAAMASDIGSQYSSMYNSNLGQVGNVYTTAAGQVGNAYNTTTGAVSDTFGTVSSAESNYNAALGTTQDAYNSSLLSANDLNNTNQYAEYDRLADAWMYDQAVANGLYSTPSTGSGSTLGTLSSVGGAVSTGAMGLAASGVIGTGATAAGVGIAGAAAGAVAAICWLARKLLPDKWKAYRKWLFTEAPEEFRLKYLYNARRIANSI